MQVNYIWLSYETTAGVLSKLVFNETISLDTAKKFINSLTTKELYRNRPPFGKTTRIKLVAQNLTTGEVLYRRTINIISK